MSSSKRTTGSPRSLPPATRLVAGDPYGSTPRQPAAGEAPSSGELDELKERKGALSALLGWFKPSYEHTTNMRRHWTFRPEEDCGRAYIAVERALIESATITSLDPTGEPSTRALRPILRELKALEEASGFEVDEIYDDISRRFVRYQIEKNATPLSRLHGYVVLKRSFTITVDTASGNINLVADVAKGELFTKLQFTCKQDSLQPSGHAALREGETVT